MRRAGAERIIAKSFVDIRHMVHTAPPMNTPVACSPMSEEAARLAALRHYEILDTPRETQFDDFTQLAACICGAPVSLISLVDENRQWFKSSVGVQASETPLDQSICRHAILQKGLFVVPDTEQDPRTAGNPLVTGHPRFRFYAGVLLESGDGHPLGTLCVLDFKPRQITQEQGRMLEALARQVMTAMEFRVATRDLARRNAQLEQALKEIKTLEGLLNICAQCKKIRDGESDWVPVESYVQSHTHARFSHGLCPVCAQAFLDDLDKLAKT